MSLDIGDDISHGHSAVGLVSPGVVGDIMAPSGYCLGQCGSILFAVFQCTK